MALSVVLAMVHTCMWKKIFMIMLLIVNQLCKHDTIEQRTRNVSVLVFVVKTTCIPSSILSMRWMSLAPYQANP